MKKWNRRDWIRGAAGIGFSGTGCFGYGSLIEKRRPQLEHVTCPVPEKFGHLDGLTIGLLSDFHFDEFGDEALVRTAVRMINQEQVDLVVLAGDFVSNQAESLAPLGEILKDLKARLGVFAILGNHDQWMGSRHATGFLKRAGIRLLRNGFADLGDFRIAGLESAWAGRPDPSKAVAGAHRDTPIILGWHEPDTFDQFDDERVVLQLSGHTHGGQVCAPLLGPLLLPHLGKKYPAGLFSRGESKLYVTRGLGVISVPARFLCPPEVSILELKKAT